ncbi:MAG: hypothetical protein U0X93_00405 [Anaerolineales bacterium]
MRNGDRARLFHRMIHIVLLDNISVHRRRAAAVHRRNVRARDAHQRGSDLKTGR